MRRASCVRALAVLAAAGTVLAGGCRSRQPSTSAENPAPQPTAAAEMQSPPEPDVRPANEEERQALDQARTDIDEQMRAVVAEKDAEIERLKAENAELKKQIGAP